LFVCFIVTMLVLPLITGWGSATTTVSAGTTTRAARLFTIPIHDQSARLSDYALASLGLHGTGVYSVSQQPTSFASQAFQRTWARTDSPVASGQVKRSWYWGPTPNSGGLQEDY